MIRGLYAETYLPFRPLLLKFPPVKNKPSDLAEVHLFTGLNGTGKTRILSVLAAILGNPDPLSRRLRATPPTSFHVTDAESSSEKQNPATWQPSFTAQPGQQFHWKTTNSFLLWLQTVPAFAYAGNAYIGDAPVGLMAEVPKPSRPECLQFNRPPDTASSIPLMQLIANLKVQAAMALLGKNKDPHASPQVKLIRGIEAAISEVSGLPFEFEVSSPRLAVGANWGGRSIHFELLPDGLRAIIGWFAHATIMINAFFQGNAGSPLDVEAVFLLDEIESHLHPAWQRKVLPAFQRLFPRSQIFVATHSPFVISSLNHGWIHSLTAEADGMVRSGVAIPASEGDSYVSVIEDIMGVREWYDVDTEIMLGQYRKLRDAAVAGDGKAFEEVKVLAANIGHRSRELSYMMGRELSQLERQLGKSVNM